MRLLAVSLTLVGLVIGLSLVPHAMARTNSGGLYSVYPRVDATVIALEAQGLALIRTTNGTTYEVVQRPPMWQVGDRVVCKHAVYTRMPWEQLDCQKVSGRE